MCHDKDNASMIKTTGSSNKAHGICCKPGYSGEHCNDGDDNHICSLPAAAVDTPNNFKSILTDGPYGKMNH